MLDGIQYVYVLIIGIISGIVGGSLGTSGSNVIIPGLLLSGVTENYKTAAGTTLLAILPPLSIGAVYTYWKSGNVQVDSAIIIVISYFIFATMAANYAVKYLSNKTLILFYAIYLLIICIYFFYKYFTYSSTKENFN
jgi:uncharacterized membrane protein YfcA